MPVVYNAPPQERNSSGDEWLSFGVNAAQLGLQFKAQKEVERQAKVREKWDAFGAKAKARGEDPWTTLSHDETAFRELYTDMGFSEEAVESQWNALKTDPKTYKQQAEVEMNKIMGKGAPAPEDPSVQSLVPPSATPPQEDYAGPWGGARAQTPVPTPTPSPGPGVTERNPPTLQGPVPRVKGAPVPYPGGEPLSYNVGAIPPSVSSPLPTPWVGNRGEGYGMQTQAPGGVQGGAPANAPMSRGQAYQAAANARKAASMDEGVPAASAPSNTRPQENPIMNAGDFEGGVLPAIPGAERFQVHENMGGQGGPVQEKYVSEFAGMGPDAKERLRKGIGMPPNVVGDAKAEEGFIAERVASSPLAKDLALSTSAVLSKGAKAADPKIAQEGVTLSKAMDAAAYAGETGDMKAYRGAQAEAIRASRRYASYVGRVISTAEYEDISRTPEGRKFLADSFSRKLSDPAWRASYALVHPESANIMEAIGRENDPAFKALAEGRGMLENAKTQAELAKAQADIIKAQLGLKEAEMGLEGKGLDLESRRLGVEADRIGLEIAKTNLAKAREKGKDEDSLKLDMKVLDDTQAIIQNAIAFGIKQGTPDSYLKDAAFQDAVKRANEILVKHKMSPIAPGEIVKDPDIWARIKRALVVLKGGDVVVPGGSSASSPTVTAPTKVTPAPMTPLEESLRQDLGL